MPLYDCVMLMKPHLKKESMMDLIARVGKHVYARNGVLTNLKPVESVQLGYGIKKLDGRYFQGNLVQMTMMATPNINKELHYLNKDDRLLRWLLVNHRDNYSNAEDARTTGYGLDFLANEDGKGDQALFSRASLYADADDDEDVDDDDEDDYDDNESNDKAEGEKNEA